MANPIQQAGGASEPTSFAPLHTNRIFTGLWSNRSPLRDAAVTGDMEQYGFGRQDSILGGQNSEISTRLTLRRRPGLSPYNNVQNIPPIKRFYSFNTFTLTDEHIRVMADTAGAVLDVTHTDGVPDTVTTIWTKTAGAGPTFFLGVGNTLYFTNGIDNKQWNYGANKVYNWGIAAPTTAPVISQGPRPSPPPGWSPDTGYEVHASPRQGIIIMGSDGSMQVFNGTGVTGVSEPNPWGAVGTYTGDGSVSWYNLGFYVWAGNTQYPLAAVLSGMSLPSDVFYTFVATTAGHSGTSQPRWPAGLNLQIGDGPPTGSTDPAVIWTNVGRTLHWSDIGANTQITSTTQILDPNGYLQTVIQAGLSGQGPTPPQFGTQLGAQTIDNTVVWQNMGPWSVGTTATVQWGYAYKNSVTGDISNMSPASAQISIIQGNQVTVQGDGSSDPQVDTIVIYRIAQGGSTFIYLTEIPAPPAGEKWTYIDNSPDSELNPLIQAQVNGEGTPLPQGASCMAYHLQRIFAAVGNVVYVSEGPDAVVSTSSGNAGFNTTFTLQSKITRFWVSTLGLVVFTVRDCYIILGTATDTDPLYVTTFMDGMPLASYDAFTTHLTTPYLMTSTNMVLALDPSAGITEVSFPIADLIEKQFNPANSYVTFHVESSEDHALYVANGATGWYRMAATTAPESGFSWSPQAILGFDISSTQSVEVEPGVFRLLLGPGPGYGPIYMRDHKMNTDNGYVFPANTTFGSIVLAQPGQLAGLAFITLESVLTGSKPTLSVLMGETSGTFESLNRTRQDPPNLPPSTTLYSDRYHFMQSQTPVWCRHFQMNIAWAAEDAPNELLTFTIFGQTWSEYRSQ